jgi:hypothetical protein
MIALLLRGDDQLWIGDAAFHSKGPNRRESGQMQRWRAPVAGFSGCYWAYLPAVIASPYGVRYPTRRSQISDGWCCFCPLIYLLKPHCPDFEGSPAGLINDCSDNIALLVFYAISTVRCGMV